VLKEPSELKELKAVSPALHKRFFGGADGHAAAVQAIQDELTAVAAAKRGGMPLADQLDSQRRFVDACVKADSVAMAQLEAGNKAEAGRLFADVSKDEEQPETLRSRARQMAGLLGVDAIVDVEKLLEDEEVVASGGNGGAALAN
jgi:hypothetical protein